MISTDLQDIMFGTPVPVLGTFNLGVLKEDQVNVVVHGHEPLLPELSWPRRDDPEINQKAAKARRKGHQPRRHVLLRERGAHAPRHPCGGELPPAGACHGDRRRRGHDGRRPVRDAGPRRRGGVLPHEAHHHFRQGEDRGGRAHGVPPRNGPRHGKEDPEDGHRELPEQAPQRRHPPDTQDGVVGFSHETINYLLGGLFRASYKPLNDNIINGRIRGVAGVVGCNNARGPTRSGPPDMIKELLKNDVIVLSTGCAPWPAARRASDP